MSKKKPSSSARENSDSSGGMEDEIQVEFEARTAEDVDIPGITVLLKQLFPENVDLHQLSSVIVSHNYVGSVIKQAYDDMDVDGDDDDDDGDGDDDANQVYGVNTVINMSVSKDKCIDEVRQVLVGKCECEEGKSRLTSTSQGHTGLVISERFLHIPPQIAPPLYTSLWKDIDKAVHKSMPYKFSQFVVICKTFRSNNPKDTDITFGKAEEEIFHGLGEMSYSYKVKETEVKDDFDTYNTVVILSRERFENALGKIKDLFVT